MKVFPAQFWVQFSTSYNFELTWQYGWAWRHCRWRCCFCSGRAFAWPWESQGVQAEVLRNRLGQALLNLVSVAVCLFVALSVLLPWPLLLDTRLGRICWMPFAPGAGDLEFILVLGSDGDAVPALAWRRFAGLARADLAAIFSAGRAVGVLLIYL
ncbi:MAG: hypothetical protein CM1200mP29_07580 [Verrucomicrobiota bacterium]|nr:MAG: hypothetical protein CM1200mP29_07580 [Verrucomicrobiota bacterium]